MIYFVSDIHLAKGEDELIAMFDQFVHWSIQKKPKAIYIVGDFFALWLGRSYQNVEWVKQVAQSIQRLKDNSIQVYFQRGNRDIMMSQTSALGLGLNYLNDFTVIKEDGRSILLTHGDLLVEDVDYVKFRKLVTGKLFTRFFNLIPLCLRLKIASSMRQKSKLRYQQYVDRLQQEQPDQDINTVLELAKYDTSEELVKFYAAQYQCSVVINGHIHKQQHKKLGLVDQYVMADWQPGKFSILLLDNGEFKFLNELSN